ncbi:hypothetical protein GCM10028833_31880 [Glycomyces tarimensis]
MLEREFLEHGERLYEWVPVWHRLPVLEGIPKPRRTVSEAAAALPRAIGRLLMRTVGIVVVIIVVFMAESGDVGSGVGRSPSIVARGQGERSQVARAIAPALRRKGVWVLTDRRLAFVEVRGRVWGEWISSEPGKNASAERYPSVEAAVLVEIPAEQFVFEPRIERTRKRRITGRRKHVGYYRRVVFPDGSRIDFRKR